MKNETPVSIWRRITIFGFLLITALGILDRSALNSRIEEEKNQIVLEALENNKVLSDELNVLFHRVQDDFLFFEKEILDLMTLNPSSERYKIQLKLLIAFLETHPGYFKVRLTNSDGQEKFKIVQNEDHSHFSQSNLLYDLSKQPFYMDLNTVKKHEFYFSSIEPNIINGVVEQPLRPTVRISKRIFLDNGETNLLVFNIDGYKIINLFLPDRHSNERLSEKALLDASGIYIASYPQLEKQLYIYKKKSIPKVFKSLTEKQDLQGVIENSDEMIVFSKIILPKTEERWSLITRIPRQAWEKAVYKKRLTWIFWGLLCFVILMVWFWKHEKKRYKDEVVEVLLKERNEFIQNVSHQLKTPLAIMINSLNNSNPSKSDWDEIKKEINHLIKVVDDMLLLALVDATPVIPLQQESILEILINAIEMTGAKANEKGITIKLNVDEKLQETNDSLERSVMGDLLTSAIMNLIDNAIDFSPRGESVEILVSSIGSKLIIQIKDNGPGIAEELIPRLFERFSRGKNANRKGTGLGLSITKKIIDLHKGEIKLLESKKGTVFEISL